MVKFKIQKVEPTTTNAFESSGYDGADATANIAYGSSFKVTGYLLDDDDTPLSGKNVTIKFWNPDKTNLTVTVTTDSNGVFTRVIDFTSSLLEPYITKDSLWTLIAWYEPPSPPRKQTDNSGKITVIARPVKVVIDSGLWYLRPGVGSSRIDYGYYDAIEDRVTVATLNLEVDNITRYWTDDGSVDEGLFIANLTKNEVLGVAYSYIIFPSTHPYGSNYIKWGTLTDTNYELISNPLYSFGNYQWTGGKTAKLVYVGTPTRISLSVPDEIHYWGNAVDTTVTAEVLDSDTNEYVPCIDTTIHLSGSVVNSDGTLFETITPLDTEADANGEITWSITQRNMWSDKLVKLQAVIDEETSVIRTILRSEDTAEYVCSRNTTTIEKTAIPNTAFMGSGTDITITLKDTILDTPLANKKVGIAISSVNWAFTPKNTSSTASTTDANGEITWTVFPSGTGPAIATFNFPLTDIGSTGEPYYNSSYESETLSIWHTRTRMTTSPDTSIISLTLGIGETATLRYILEYQDLYNVWRGLGEKDVYITLNYDTNELEGSPKTTDSGGLASINWTPTVANTGTGSVKGGFDGDGSYGPSDATILIRVPKEGTTLTLTGPSTLEIDETGNYYGTLTETDTGVAMADRAMKLFKGSGIEPVYSQTTDANGDYYLRWTPELADLGTHNMRVVYSGDDIYEPSTETQVTTVTQKSGSISYDIEDINPVPNSTIDITGYLLSTQFAEKGDETIILKRNGVQIDSATTSSSVATLGAFSFTDIDVGAAATYTYTLYWAGDSEWDPITENITVTVAKEDPSIAFAVPNTTLKGADTRISAFLVSNHGATTSDITLKIFNVGSGTVSYTGTTDSDGLATWTETFTKGIYTWRVDFDGNTQFNAGSSGTDTLYVIDEPDWSRPKYRVRLYDSSGSEKSISPISKITSFDIKKSTESKADTFSLVIPNKDGVNSSYITEGSLITIELGYEPTDWDKLPVAIKGVIEDVEKGITSSGEEIDSTGQDYAIYLKNRQINVSYDLTLEGNLGTPANPIYMTPEFLLSGTGNNMANTIFDEAGLTNTFDFEIIAPSGYPNRKYFTFDEMSVLDALKEIRDSCKELTGNEYEFFVESTSGTPKFIFRPKLASPLSAESLEVGDNVVTCTIDKITSLIKNKVTVLGDKKPIETSETFISTKNQTKFILSYTGIESANVYVDDVTQEEGVDYEIESDLGAIRFLSSRGPREGGTVRIAYRYLARLRSSGGERRGGTYTSGYWMDNDSITLYGRKDFTPEPTSLTEQSQLDRVARAIVETYSDPIEGFKITTMGMTMTDAGYDIHLIYDSENIDDDYKIVDLEQSFSKSGGFRTNLTLKETLPDVNTLIANIIKGQKWYSY